MLIFSFQHFHKLLGLTRTQFDRILTLFKEKINSSDTGRPRALALNEQLLLFLLWMRNYIRYEFFF